MPDLPANTKLIMHQALGPVLLKPVQTRKDMAVHMHYLAGLFKMRFMTPAGFFLQGYLPDLCPVAGHAFFQATGFKWPKSLASTKLL